MANDADDSTGTGNAEGLGEVAATEQRRERLTLNFIGPPLALPGEVAAQPTLESEAHGAAAAELRERLEDEEVADAWVMDRLVRTTLPPPGSSRPPAALPETPGLPRPSRLPRASLRPPPLRTRASFPPAAADASDDADDALSLVDRAPRSEPPPFDLAAEMLERYALGDFTGALTAAELLLGQAPDHAEARRCAEHARAHLIHIYSSRVGALSARPRVIVDGTEIRWLGLDHRAGELLACIDGATTCLDLIERAGLDHIEGLKMLTELLESGAIAVDEG